MSILACGSGTGRRGAFILWLPGLYANDYIGWLSLCAEGFGLHQLQTNKVSHYTTHSYLQHDRACAEGEKAWVRGYLYTFPGPAVAKVGGIRVIKLQWHSFTRKLTHKAEILLPIAVPVLLGTVLHGRSKVCRAPLPL